MKLAIDDEETMLLVDEDSVVVTAFTATMVLPFFVCIVGTNHRGGGGGRCKLRLNGDVSLDTGELGCLATAVVSEDVDELTERGDLGLGLEGVPKSLAVGDVGDPKVDMWARGMVDGSGITGLAGCFPGEEVDGYSKGEIQNSCPKCAIDDNCCLLLVFLMALGSVN